MNKPKIEDYQVPTSWDEVMETDTESYAKALEKWGDELAKSQTISITSSCGVSEYMLDQFNEINDLLKQVEECQEQTYQTLNHFLSIQDARDAMKHYLKLLNKSK